MSTGTRLPLHLAHAVALALVATLRPACLRVEIAGSIRRKRADVGDVEVVAVPRMEQGVPVAMFEPAPEISALDPVLARLQAEGRVVPHPTDPKNGERYKKLWLPKAGLQLDLFIVTLATWGPQFAIRTGPVEYSKRLVTALNHKGWRCERGTVYDREGEPVPCPEERDFLAACGEPWTEPEHRR